VKELFGEVTVGEAGEILCELIKAHGMPVTVRTNLDDRMAARWLLKFYSATSMKQKQT
jgi:hypothetical protein